jgi:hypothetical protein
MVVYKKSESRSLNPVSWHSFVFRLEKKMEYPYFWNWSNCKIAGPEYPLKRYKGKSCRVIVRGKSMNSCLIEFEDGARYVTSRNGIRKRK